MRRRTQSTRPPASARRHASVLRHGFSSRSRLLDAAIAVIAEFGVEQATIPAICAEAGIGQSTFEKDFVDLTDCMLTVFDELANVTLTRVRVALMGESSWEDGVRSALIALLELAEQRPNLARFMLGEPRVGDLPILTRRERLQCNLAAALDERRPRGSASSAFSATAAIDAAAASVRVLLRARTSQPLRELAPALTAMIVPPQLGAERASELVRREGLDS